MKSNDISNLSKLDLVLISKELQIMADMDSPRTHVRSELLNSVWIDGDFSEIFNYTRILISSEIIRRINKDIF